MIRIFYNNYSFSRSVAPIIVGRVITGLCSGIAMGALPTYVTEISTPNIRGLIGMAFNVSESDNYYNMNKYFQH